MTTRGVGFLPPLAAIQRRGALTVARIPAEGTASPTSIDYRDLIARLEDLYRQRVITRVLRVELLGGGSADFHLLREGVFLTVLRGASIHATFTAPGLCALRVRVGSFVEDVDVEVRESEDFDCSFLYLDSDSLRWTYRSSPDQPASSISIFIAPDQLAAMLDETEEPTLRSLVPLAGAEAPHARLVDLAPSAPLRRAANDLLALNADEPGYRLRVEARSLALVAEALAGLAGESADTSGAHLDASAIQALESVRSWIAEDYAGSATLEQLARRAGMNRRKLTEGFKKLFGTTIHEYRVEQRMNRAAELLRDGLSAGAVSLEVGYRDQGSFTAAFRRFFGRTPRAYKGGSSS